MSAALRAGFRSVALNPGLVVVSLSSFGSEGPDAGLKAWEEWYGKRTGTG